MQEFVERQVPEDWDGRSIEERRAYWSDWGGEAQDADTLVQRSKVCALEVWCELFEGDPKSYDTLRSREITNLLNKLPGWERKSMVRPGGAYGRQRGYVKKL